MSYEWFPWYPALFRADTMHLTAEQDGIYRRLIDHYMETRQPLPDSDTALARIAGVSVDSWAMAAAMVRPFFKASAQGFLHHKKCDNVLAVQDGRNKKQSEKGKKGAEKRWKKNAKLQEAGSSGYATAMPQLWPEDATRHDTIEELSTNVANKKKNTKKKKSDSYTPAFENFWKAYPKNDGSKSTASEKFEAAVASGVAPETIAAQAAAYADHIQRSGAYTAHAATWLHQKRWEVDYATLPAERNQAHEPKQSSKRQRLIASTHDAFTSITSANAAPDPFNLRGSGGAGSPENAGGLLRGNAPVRQGAGGDQGNNAGVLQRVGSVPDAKDS